MSWKSVQAFILSETSLPVELRFWTSWQSRKYKNGDLIVYTSADSVLQICGNEETMGVETLYITVKSQEN